MNLSGRQGHASSDGSFRGQMLTLLDAGSQDVSSLTSTQEAPAQDSEARAVDAEQLRQCPRLATEALVFLGHDLGRGPSSSFPWLLPRFLSLVPGDSVSYLIALQEIPLLLK